MAIERQRTAGRIERLSKLARNGLLLAAGTLVAVGAVEGGFIAAAGALFANGMADSLGGQRRSDNQIIADNRTAEKEK